MNLEHSNIERQRGDDSEGRKADDWLTFAITAAIFSVIGIVAASLWAFAGAGPDRHRFDMVYKAALMCAAVVTFCTVVWRGLISARQVRFQQRQIDTLTLQIIATEENNLAGLLQKGAELLAETKNRAHVAAGVATLQAIITAENDKFSGEAMELLADHIDEEYQSSNDQPIFLNIVRALELGASRGLRASRSIDFSATFGAKPIWRIFNGVERISYIGGTVQDFIDKVEIIHKTGMSFREVEFSTGKTMRIDSRFRKCNFIECEIFEIALDKNGEATFERCDFSGAFVSGSIVAPIHFENCYYSRKSPPEFPPEWMEKLSIKEDPDAPGMVADLGADAFGALQN